MNVPYKIVYLCFLALTLFSVFSIFYTVYIFYGTKFAVNGFETQILSVTVDENLQQIVMQLKLYNRYWVDLKVKYLSYKLFHNYREITTGEKFFSNPIDIPRYSTCYLNLTFSLNIDDLRTYNGIWTLYIKRMILITPIKEVIKEEMEISSEVIIP